MTTTRRGARTPEECDQLLIEHLAAGDLEAIVELYEPGAAFVTRRREVQVGRDAIRQAFRELAAARPRLRANIVMTLRNGDNLAVLYNDWSMTVRTPDGKSQETSGKAIEVLCRQADGNWKFAIDDPFGRS